MQHEAMEDLYRGYVQDVKEGCMIAVLVDEDPLGYPFWISKVLKVINKMNILQLLMYIGMPQVPTLSMVCTSQRW